MVELDDEDADGRIVIESRMSSRTVIYPHQGRHFPRLRYDWLGIAFFLISTAVMLEVHYPFGALELEKDFANLPLILGLLRYW